MAQRIKLGLVFKYDESWVAGSYYILNLLHALKTLPIENQPEVILFTNSFDDQKKVNETGYKWLVHKNYVPVLNIFEKIINKFSRIISKKNWIEKRMTDRDIDYIFLQRRSWETDLISNSKKIFWIPDCQELIMPELFFKRELDGRKHVYNEIVASKSKILFSSNAALNDFKQFYPQATNKMYVVNFAVVHPNYDGIKLKELQTKYNIKNAFFIVPNQFWVHKNHNVVLEAIIELKKQHTKFQLFFTGKENDFRAPTYTQELKQFVINNEISDIVSFLGFIPREEQLCLMKNSIAIIQPSLFEGWSTVVEDAKALNKCILLSDIKVHREQIKENAIFFNLKKPSELALIMQSQIEAPKKSVIIDYKINNNNFAQGFYEMLVH